jgi:hypothetical protein
VIDLLVLINFVQGSGKTYTMGSFSKMENSEQKGVIPRVIQQIFQYIEALFFILFSLFFFSSLCIRSIEVEYVTDLVYVSLLQARKTEFEPKKSDGTALSPELNTALPVNSDSCPPSPRYACECRVSFLEIHNEQLVDLLVKPAEVPAKNNIVIRFVFALSNFLSQKCHFFSHTCLTFFFALICGQREWRW